MSGVSQAFLEPSPDCTRLNIEVPLKPGQDETRPLFVGHIASRSVALRPPGLISQATNPNATELARKAADEFARDFKCANDEVKVIGERGTAVGLARR